MSEVPEEPQQEVEAEIAQEIHKYKLTNRVRASKVADGYSVVFDDGHSVTLPQSTFEANFIQMD